MNLQEHIRRIIKEERRFSPFINRRLPEDEVNAYFNEVKNRLMGMITSDNSSMMDKDEFKQFIITYTINFIMENYYDTFPEMTDFYEKLFDDLYEYYNNEMDESYGSINNMILQENIRRILIEENIVIPSFMMRRIDEYVNNILSAYGNHDLKGSFRTLIDEISDLIINDLLSDYIDSIGYTVDDEDDKYDQSVVDKVYDKYYNLLADHIQGNYSDEIYKLFIKNKR
jgi:hypothetical protein